MNLCVGESEDWQHTIFSLTLTDVEKCAFRGWTHKSKVQLTFSSPTAIQLTAVPVHSPPEDPEPPRLLIFSQITFVALFALCRAFCSLVVVGAAAWTMPHTHKVKPEPAVSSALLPHRFIQSLFCLWVPVGVQVLHVSSGVRSRRNRIGWRELL